MDDGILTGHLGEWFSTAVAAYGALRRKDPDRAAAMAALIDEEMVRQARIFEAFKRAGDGVNLLKSATILAHNLGDFDRVVDMWALDADDPLRRWYKAGHEAGREKALKQAGDLNKALMAIHSHRHFPLREPKALRRAVPAQFPLDVRYLCRPIMYQRGLVSWRPGVWRRPGWQVLTQNWLDH